MTSAREPRVSHGRSGRRGRAPGTPASLRAVLGFPSLFALDHAVTPATRNRASVWRAASWAAWAMSDWRDRCIKANSSALPCSFD